jgi:putative hydrolase of the HAD superfamily
MPPYRAVIFDLFYTLINPLDSRYMEKSEYGILRMSREDFEGRNAGGYAAWAEGRIRDPGEIVRRILAGLDYPEETIQAVAEARMERIRRGLMEVEPKNLRLLARLRRRGIRTLLLSNADVMDTRHWEESPLAPCFDGAIFSWQAGVQKPQPGIYALALERLGALPPGDSSPVSPGDCLYVGDGGHGELRGARAAGFPTVLTVEYIRNLWPRQIPALAAWADHTVGDITDIEQLCGEPQGDV